MARILLIDDDDPLRELLAQALRQAGHTVVEAVDGRQGMELYRTTEIDLVVTDLIMPEQEGVETILALHHDRPKLPIIAISGGVSNSRLYLDIAGKIGADRMLAKPFKSAELIELIDALLTSPDAAR